MSIFKEKKGFFGNLGAKIHDTIFAKMEVDESVMDELEEILRGSVAYCHENGMEIAFTSPGWLEEEVFEELNIASPSCGACLSNMAVTPGGNVVPCQSWLSGKPLGNMLTDDWNVIWESEACRTRRDFSAQVNGECPLRRYR